MDSILRKIGFYRDLKSFDSFKKDVLKICIFNILRVVLSMVVLVKCISVFLSLFKRDSRFVEVAIKMPSMFLTILLGIVFLILFNLPAPTERLKKKYKECAPKKMVEVKKEYLSDTPEILKDKYGRFNKIRYKAKEELTSIMGISVRNDKGEVVKQERILTDVINLNFFSGEIVFQVEHVEHSFLIVEEEQFVDERFDKFFSDENRRELSRKYTFYVNDGAQDINEYVVG
ncbi:hypothetical protein [Enterococcus faecalis]|uniref:hypothetical protein n=1 Tax=Enterococcus faecalis TaxID=1351 RepID=UPI001AD6A214|nr:hypothetical protein [Enterococcus faecalis]MBO6322913.1 hypothetical protein [Enterococcus faecalis]